MEKIDQVVKQSYGRRRDFTDKKLRGAIGSIENIKLDNG